MILLYTSYLKKCDHKAFIIIM